MQNNSTKLLLSCLMAALLLTMAISTQVFAVDNVVETTFFGNLKDDGEGCGVYTILNSIVDILSIGIGILAVIGITIVGTKYLTAKDNIDQVQKAKHRMFQIVIGIIAYVLLYAGVQWLLPGGKLNANQQCTTISDAELAALKNKNQESKATNSSTQTKTTSKKTNNNTNKNEATKNSGKVLEAAKNTAKTFESLKVTYCNLSYGSCRGESYTWGKLKQIKQSHCNSFVNLALRKSGLLHNYRLVFGRKGKLNYTSAAKKDIDKNFIIKNGKCRSVKELVNDKMLVPGDAVGYCGGHGHALIYAGKSKNGKYSFYEVDGPNGKVLTYNNIIKRTRPASFQIGDILHAK